MSHSVREKVERSFLCSPIGLQIRDGFTGQLPLGRLELQLERKLVDGNWRQVDFSPSMSRTGVWSFPGLGRTVSFENTPTDFRVTIDAEYYTSVEQIDVKVHAYSDTRPLSTNQYDRTPRRVELRPNSRYPFPTNQPIVRGRVVDSNKVPLENAKVRYKNNVHVFTDVDGFFTVPILWPPEGVWPPSEIQLVKQARFGTDRIVVSSLVGIRTNDQFEIEQDGGVVLTVDAEIDQAEIVVNDVGEIRETMAILICDPSLSLARRRFAIDSIDSSSNSITLNANLPAQIPTGTKVLLRSNRYQVQAINSVNSTVTLSSELTEPWSRESRLVRFHRDLALDVSIDGYSRSIDVPVPDGFRLLEVELT